MELLPFQKEAVNTMLGFLTRNRTHACLNASEQGTGKTIQAIATFNRLNYAEKAFRILIVCPAIMRLVWRDELKTWLRNKDLTTLVVTNGKTLAQTESHDITIVSYDLLPKKSSRELLKTQTFDLLIFDEAHYLKNRKAKRTKVCLEQIWKICKYRICLTGTPFRQSVVDGFTLFNRIDPDTFPEFWEFAHAYCNVSRTPFGHTFTGVKNSKALKTLIRDRFFLRYKKEDVLPDLPPKTFQQITLPWDEYAVIPRASNEKEALQMEALLVKKALEKGVDMAAPVNLSQHRKLQGIKIVPAVAEFVSQKLDEGIPVVLFAWHRDVISGLAAALEGYKPSVITGDTPNKLRHSHIQNFQEGKSNLIILQYIAGGIGVTLHRSSTCVLAELDWVPATISQGVDRLHRIGQKKNVTVYYFVVEKSVTEDILRTVVKRAKDYKAVLD